VEEFAMRKSAAMLGICAALLGLTSIVGTGFNQLKNFSISGLLATPVPS
jgi:hypothetical protein